MEQIFNRTKQPYHQSQHLAIRHGDWKLLVNADGTDMELYNIKEDRNETTNIAHQHPKLASDLSHKVINWYKTKRKVRRDRPIKD